MFQFGSIFSGYGAYSSGLDDLLQKRNLTLDDILDEENILMEIRSGSDKLGKILFQKSKWIKELISIVINEPKFADDKKNRRYPFIASEIFKYEVDGLINGLFDVPPASQGLIEDQEDKHSSSHNTGSHNNSMEFEHNSSGEKQDQKEEIENIADQKIQSLLMGQNMHMRLNGSGGSGMQGEEEEDVVKIEEDLEGEVVFKPIHSVNNGKEEIESLEQKHSQIVKQTLVNNFVQDNDHDIIKIDIQAQVQAVQEEAKDKGQEQDKPERVIEAVEHVATGIELLAYLLSFLEKPDSTQNVYLTQTAYFSKALIAILNKRPRDFIQYMFQKPTKHLNLLLSHINSKSIQDVYLRILNLETDIDLSEFSMAKEELFAAQNQMVDDMFELLIKSQSADEIENICTILVEALGKVYNVKVQSQNVIDRIMTKKHLEALLHILKTHHNSRIINSVADVIILVANNQLYPVIDSQDSLIQLQSEPTTNKYRIANQMPLVTLDILEQNFQFFIEQLNPNDCATTTLQPSQFVPQGVPVFGLVRLQFVRLINICIQILESKSIANQAFEHNLFGTLLSFVEQYEWNTFLVQEVCNIFQNIFNYKITAMDQADVMQDKVLVERRNANAVTYYSAVLKKASLHDTLDKMLSGRKFKFGHLENQVEHGYSVFALRLANQLEAKRVLQATMNEQDHLQEALLNLCVPLNPTRWEEVIVQFAMPMNTTQIVDLGGKNPRYTPPVIFNDDEKKISIEGMSKYDHFMHYQTPPLMSLSSTSFNEPLTGTQNVKKEGDEEQIQLEIQDEEDNVYLNKHFGLAELKNKSPQANKELQEDEEEEDTKEMRHRKELELQHEKLYAQYTSEKHGKALTEYEKEQQSQKQQFKKEDLVRLQQENEKMQGELQKQRSVSQYQKELLKEREKRIASFEACQVETEKLERFKTFVEINMHFDGLLDPVLALQDDLANREDVQQSEEFFIHESEITVKASEQANQQVHKDNEDLQYTQKQGTYKLQPVTIREFSLPQQYILPFLKQFKSFYRFRNNAYIVKLYGVSLKSLNNNNDNGNQMYYRPDLGMVQVQIVSEPLGTQLNVKLEQMHEANEKCRNNTKYKILNDVLKAMRAVHDEGIPHIGIRPTNVYIDSQFNAKLDFGQQGIIMSFKKGGYFENGDRYFSPEYMGLIARQASSNSPSYVTASIDLHKNPQLLIKSDIWHFGCLVYELLKESQVWQNVSQKRLASIFSARKSFFDDNNTTGDKTDVIIEQCLDYFPHKRPDSLTLIKLFSEL